MAHSVKSLLLSLLLGSAVAHAQFPSAITHVVVIFQENRTPDNLFQGLYGLVGSNGTAYDIQNFWVDTSGKQHPLRPAGLSTNFGLPHNHAAFTSELTDPREPLATQCSGVAIPVTFGCAANSWNQFMFVDNNPESYNNSYGKGTIGLLDPYLNLAKQYGWANFMYQTNQGPSYPAHQYIFGGTSARSASEDSQAIFVAENPLPATGFAGCLGQTETDVLIDPSGKETQFGGTPGSLCFNHDTLATLLDNHLPQPITWKYYTAGAGSIWSAPNSIQAICQPNSNFTQCKGPEWTANVALNPADILTDINACNLPGVGWVIPAGNWSDHANGNYGLGPSWVAAVVNAIGGTGNSCGYWNNTAIVITWDDWGGWFDHEPPFVISGIQGDYQLGFRVPLIVVSAYTQQGYVSSVKPYDFGSILLMIEDIFGLGSLGFADSRATNNLQEFFNLSTPRTYTVIPAVEDASYFLKSQDPLLPPDDD
jgi:phospholipase C